MEPTIAIFVGVSFVAGLALGYLVGRKTSGTVLIILWACLAAPSFLFLSDPLMDLFGFADGGWDRLGYAIIAMFFLLPALLGSILTGVLGRYHRRRDEGEHGL